MGLGSAYRFVPTLQGKGTADTASDSGFGLRPIPRCGSQGCTSRASPSTGLHARCVSPFAKGAWLAGRGSGQQGGQCHATPQARRAKPAGGTVRPPTGLCPSLLLGRPPPPPMANTPEGWVPREVGTEGFGYLGRYVPRGVGTQGWQPAPAPHTHTPHGRHYLCERRHTRPERVHPPKQPRAVHTVPE